MQKSWDQVGWVLWWRHTTASITSPLASLLYTAINKEVKKVLRQGDIVVIRNRGNLRSLLSGRKHLRKNSCAAFCPHSLLQLGAVSSQPANYLTWLCSCQVLTVFS
jgi:hypothetical protein